MSRAGTTIAVRKIRTLEKIQISNTCAEVYYTPINFMMIRKKIQVIFNKAMASPMVIWL
jgi:hypothetical protein